MLFFFKLYLRISRKKVWILSFFNFYSVLFSILIGESFLFVVTKLLVITAVKILVIGTCMFTLAGAAVGTGVLFAGYTLSAAKNPEEADNLFNTTLMAFALIETFVFISFVVAIVAFFL